MDVEYSHESGSQNEAETTAGWVCVGSHHEPVGGKPMVAKKPVTVRRISDARGLLPDRAGEDSPAGSGYDDGERKTDEEYYAERPPHW